MDQTSKVGTEPIVDSPVAMLADLRSTLETIADLEVNVPVSDSLHTIAPRKIIDSGSSISFVRD